jgi:TPR repeat protein
MAAKMLFEGKGCEKNVDSAIEYADKAASLDHAEANYLGIRLEQNKDFMRKRVRDKLKLVEKKCYELESMGKHRIVMQP